MEMRGRDRVGMPYTDDTYTPLWWLQAMREGIRQT